MKRAASTIILTFLVVIGFAHITYAQTVSQSGKLAYAVRMNRWLDTLAMAESNDDPKLVFLDVNHKYSYSCLQFQKGTWDFYTKKFGISGNIMDCQTQREVAKMMIATNYNLWRSWWTSVKIKGVGLPPTV